MVDQVRNSKDSKPIILDQEEVKVSSEPNKKLIMNKHRS